MSARTARAPALTYSLLQTPSPRQPPGPLGSGLYPIVHRSDESGLLHRDEGCRRGTAGRHHLVTYLVRRPLLKQDRRPFYYPVDEPPGHVARDALPDARLDKRIRKERHVRRPRAVQRRSGVEERLW